MRKIDKIYDECSKDLDKIVELLNVHTILLEELVKRIKDLESNK